MTDRINLFDAVIKNRRAGKAVALATVVRVEKPSSARPGDSALITADGQFSGWVGGSCAQPTILREALKALKDGNPRFVRLTPPEKRAGVPAENVIEVALTCISGGTLEVYIEPIMPQPQLIAIGHLPVIQGLVKLAGPLDYEITVAGLDLPPGYYSGSVHVLESI
ncbi:MAG: XdhC family protein, partial [Anaerolineales bacterium]|nr:XdhC family protein [Anaerolineales bacterium]